MASSEWLEEKAEQEKYDIITENVLDGLERCRLCGEFFEEDSDKLYKHDLCIDCIESKITHTMLITYIWSEKLESAFYVEFLYDTTLNDKASKELIKLCRKDFISTNNVEQMYAKRIEFIKQDFSHFVDWLETKI